MWCNEFYFYVCIASRTDNEYIIFVQVHIKRKGDSQNPLTDWAFSFVNPLHNVTFSLAPGATTVTPLIVQDTTPAQLGGFRPALSQPQQQVSVCATRPLHVRITAIRIAICNPIAMPIINISCCNLSVVMASPL